MGSARTHLAEELSKPTNDIQEDNVLKIVAEFLEKGGNINSEQFQVDYLDSLAPLGGNFTTETILQHLINKGREDIIRALFIKYPSLFIIDKPLVDRAAETRSVAGRFLSYTLVLYQAAALYRRTAFLPNETQRNINEAFINLINLLDRGSSNDSLFRKMLSDYLKMLDPSLTAPILTIISADVTKYLQEAIKQNDIERVQRLLQIPGFKVFKLDNFLEEKSSPEMRNLITLISTWDPIVLQFYYNTPEEHKDRTPEQNGAIQAVKKLGTIAAEDSTKGKETAQQSYETFKDYFQCLHELATLELKLKESKTTLMLLHNFSETPFFKEVNSEIASAYGKIPTGTTLLKIRNTIGSIKTAFIILEQFNKQYAEIFNINHCTTSSAEEIEATKALLELASTIQNNFSKKSMLEFDEAYMQFKAKFTPIDPLFAARIDHIKNNDNQENVKATKLLKQYFLKIDAIADEKHISAGKDYLKKKAIDAYVRNDMKELLGIREEIIQFKKCIKLGNAISKAFNSKDREDATTRSFEAHFINIKQGNFPLGMKSFQECAAYLQQIKSGVLDKLVNTYKYKLTNLLAHKGNSNRDDVIIRLLSTLKIDHEEADLNRVKQTARFIDYFKKVDQNLLASSTIINTLPELHPRKNYLKKEVSELYQAMHTHLQKSADPNDESFQTDIETRVNKLNKEILLAQQAIKEMARLQAELNKIPKIKESDSKYNQFNAQKNLCQERIHALLQLNTTPPTTEDGPIPDPKQALEDAIKIIEQNLKDIKMEFSPRSPLSMISRISSFFAGPTPTLPTSRNPPKSYLDEPTEPKPPDPKKPGSVM